MTEKSTVIKMGLVSDNGIPCIRPNDRESMFTKFAHETTLLQVIVRAGEMNPCLHLVNAIFFVQMMSDYYILIIMFRVDAGPDKNWTKL
jgi:hypothetical protein